MHQILHGAHLSKPFPLQTFSKNLVLDPLYLIIQNLFVLCQLLLRNLLEHVSQLLALNAEVE
jgi:hypothetical protein